MRIRLINVLVQWVDRINIGQVKRVKGRPIIHGWMWYKNIWMLKI